jgi:hypothetical protein
VIGSGKDGRGGKAMSGIQPPDASYSLVLCVSSRYAEERARQSSFHHDLGDQ